MKDNVIFSKSKAFAVRIVKLYQHLQMQHPKEKYVLPKQLLRSGTSIGANVREATQAQSKKDFISKMSIALKEASEAEYWIEVFFETDYLNEKEFQSFMEDCKELNKLLTSIVKTSKKNC